MRLVCYIFLYCFLRLFVCSNETRILFFTHELYQSIKQEIRKVNKRGNYKVQSAQLF